MNLQQKDKFPSVFQFLPFFLKFGHFLNWPFQEQEPKTKLYHRNIKHQTKNKNFIVKQTVQKVFITKMTIIEPFFKKLLAIHVAGQNDPLIGSNCKQKYLGSPRVKCFISSANSNHWYYKSPNIPEKSCDMVIRAQKKDAKTYKDAKTTFGSK